MNVYKYAIEFNFNPGLNYVQVSFNFRSIWFYIRPWIYTWLNNNLETKVYNPHPKRKLRPRQLYFECQWFDINPPCFPHVAQTLEDLFCQAVVRLVDSRWSTTVTKVCQQNNQSEIVCDNQSERISNNHFETLNNNQSKSFYNNHINTVWSSQSKWKSL